MKFLYRTTAGVPRAVFAKTRTRLLPYLKKLGQIAKDPTYQHAESSLFLPFDTKNIARVKKCVAQKTSRSLKYIFVIGIGGSNLGTQAVVDAVEGSGGLLGFARAPRIVFLDTINPGLLAQVRVSLAAIKNLQEILVVMISKSGTTTETAVNMEYVFASFSPRKRKELLSRIVVITDEGSKLWHQSHERGITVLSIPAKVGGRYSVLSAVGLFPLAAAGYDISLLLKGARTVLVQYLGSAASSSAVSSAAVLFYHARVGRTIHDTFLFAPALESLGKWYRQLLGESIGKEFNRRGKKVEVGITPTISIGSTDLHSVGQLYFGGPKDKITTFVAPPHFRESAHAKMPALFPGLIAGSEGVLPAQMIQLIYEGVKKAYQKKELPFMEVTLGEISLQALGEFFQWKMIEIMLLGELFAVNAFDQPNVELYKEETRKLLRAASHTA